jgi:Phospholipase_D-nuclease N-terminal
MDPNRPRGVDPGDRVAGDGWTCQDALERTGVVEMLYVDGGLGLLLFVLWVFCLVDVVTTDEALCRNLPKMAWVFVVLLLFDVGSVLWLVAGRTWPSSAARASGPASAYPEYDRPGRFAATDPEDDERFLRQLRERAEDQRRRHREQQRGDETGTGTETEG